MCVGYSAFSVCKVSVGNEGRNAIHSSHLAHIMSIAARMFGQKYSSFAFKYVNSGPRCGVCNLSRISRRNVFGTKILSLYVSKLLNIEISGQYFWRLFAGWFGCSFRGQFSSRALKAAIISWYCLSFSASCWNILFSLSKSTVAAAKNTAEIFAFPSLSVSSAGKTGFRDKASAQIMFLLLIHFHN